MVPAFQNLSNNNHNPYTNYYDNRPPLGRIHFLQKDSKKIFQVEFQNRYSNVIRVDQPSQFAHNF